MSTHTKYTQETIKCVPDYGAWWPEPRRRRHRLRPFAMKFRQFEEMNDVFGKILSTQCANT